jgi:hypothetical protein
MARRAGFHWSILVAGLTVVTLGAAPLHGETMDKLTYLTFSRSVQIPGAKLDAGTYRFRLTNPNTDRNVMQVLSRDGGTVYSMFLTMPDSRTRLTDQSTVTFLETPAGVPPAVKSLFYGGEHSGYAFVYPKGEPDLTVDVAQQPPITFAPIPPAVTAAPAAAAPTPAPEPAAEAQAPAAPPEPPAAATSQQPELPKTASPVPLVALGGVASLIMAFGAGLLRKLVA